MNQLFNQSSSHLSVKPNCLILLVEDSPINQQVCTLMLRQLGLNNIDIAHNGLDALQMVQEKNYDIIFMDLKMPDLDGVATTKEIRKMETLAQQPWIIAMTASVLPQKEKACLESGMNDYINKPFELDNLQTALQKYTVQSEKSEYD